MIVRAIENSFRNAPEELLATGIYKTQTAYITIGNMYEVYAIAIYKRSVIILFTNDLNISDWQPSWLFEIEDTTIPIDWHCNIFHDRVSLIIGPSFISNSLEAYNSLLLREPEQTKQFKEWLKKLRDIEKDTGSNDMEDSI